MFGKLSTKKNLLSKKIGRNDPCPCESGMKYKKCCFGDDSEGAMTREEILEMKSNPLFMEIKEIVAGKKSQYEDLYFEDEDSVDFVDIFKEFGEITLNKKNINVDALKFECLILALAWNMGQLSDYDLLDPDHIKEIVDGIAQEVFAKKNELEDQDELEALRAIFISFVMAYIVRLKNMYSYTSEFIVSCEVVEKDDGSIDYIIETSFAPDDAFGALGYGSEENDWGIDEDDEGQEPRELRIANKR